MDAAATRENAKCPRYYTKGDSALARLEWDVVERIWCNPPYSKPNLSTFLPMGRNHAARGGTNCFLVPNSTSELWFHQNILRGADVVTQEAVAHGPLEGWGLHLSGQHCNIWLHFLLGRIAYEHPNQAGTSAKKGNVLVSFSPRRRW